MSELDACLSTPPSDSLQDMYEISRAERATRVQTARHAYTLHVLVYHSCTVLSIHASVACTLAPVTCLHPLLQEYLRAGERVTVSFFTFCTATLLHKTVDAQLEETEAPGQQIAHTGNSAGS